MIRAGTQMRHVTITLMRDELPHASLLLAELDAFAADERGLLESELPEVPGHKFRARVRRARGHLERLSALLGDGPEEPEPMPPLVLQRDQLIEADRWLAEAWEQCAPCDEELHRIDEDRRELQNLARSLQDFAGLDIDLNHLQSTDTQLDLRLGTVPADNLSRLQDVLALSNHLVLNVSGSGDSRRLLIAGRREDASILDSVLHAAAFQTLTIPAVFNDSPQALERELAQREQALNERHRQLQAKLDNWRDSNRHEMQRARRLLEAAGPYVQLRGTVRGRGPLAALQGWVPAPHIDRLEQLLHEHLKLPFIIEARLPRDDERHLVPVPTQTRGLLRPFATLVEQYGIPRFGEFDPTLLFAVTFAAMFGMMFGDIGHGAIIVLTGLLLRRRLGPFTYLFVLAGGSAMVFGWLYGSIFGVEHWIEPLWIAPMSDPIYMLKVALAWGVVFLTLGSIIAIANRLSSGDASGALFGSGGVVALVLYLALLGGMISLADGRDFPSIASLLILVMLALLLGYQWMSSNAPYGERIFTTVIETFEIVSGYVTSSLSFLRVAAFSLNHVALSLAVFTLADGMGPVGHGITLVLGNLFVIVLEGIIVAIQTLRLEYYEGFSRYFYGDGTPFRPLRIGRSQIT